MILNLTQHEASPEQKAAGVIDLPPVERKELVALLTFDHLPTEEELIERANCIAYLAYMNDPRPSQVMIGGAPFFMSYLESTLASVNFKPLYAFSKRMVTEQDGKKVSTFRHEGFVPAKT